MHLNNSHIQPHILACLAVMLFCLLGSPAAAFELGTCHIFQIVESKEKTSPIGRIEIERATYSNGSKTDSTQNAQAESDSELVFEFQSDNFLESGTSSFGESTFEIKEASDAASTDSFNLIDTESSFGL